MATQQSQTQQAILSPQEQLVYQALAHCVDPRAEGMAARARFIAERREAGDKIYPVSTAPWRDR